MMTPLPVGVTLAMAFSCGALPLMAQEIYVPGSMSCLLYTSDAADE